MYGIETIELWWVFPLLCLGMMLFCMLSGFRGRMRCCGSRWRHTKTRGPCDNKL